MTQKIGRGNSGLAKVWIIAIIIILAVVVYGGIYWWNKTSTPVKESETSEEELSAEEETKPAEEPKEFVVDCGHLGPEASVEEADVIGNCIEEKFKECKPAKFAWTIDFGPLEGEMTAYYEIIGPIGNLCELKWKYLKYPDHPDWIDKEMICQLDNSKGFEMAFEIAFGTAMEDMSRYCSGPLYDLLK